MLLLYCMIPDDIPLNCGSVPGIAGAEMKELAKNGVRYFYSSWHPARGADEVRQQALEFHRANQKILEHATVIPFRFPTHVSNESDLALLMEEQSGEYAQELARLGGMVQMKVTIEGSSHAQVEARSGTEYLRQRQMANAPMESAIQAVKQAVGGGLTNELKQARRGNATVLYLLVDRDRVEAVKGKLAALEGLRAKVLFSGPWPPSEFVNCYPEPAKP